MAYITVREPALSPEVGAYVTDSQPRNEYWVAVEVRLDQENEENCMVRFVLCSDNPRVIITPWTEYGPTCLPYDREMIIVGDRAIAAEMCEMGGIGRREETQAAIDRFVARYEKARNEKEHPT